MSLEEILTNVLLMLLCYGYIGAVIFVSGKIDKIRKTTRENLYDGFGAFRGN